MARCQFQFCGRRVWPWQRQGWIAGAGRVARWHAACYRAAGSPDPLGLLPSARCWPAEPLPPEFRRPGEVVNGIYTVRPPDDGEAGK